MTVPGLNETAVAGEHGAACKHRAPSVASTATKNKPHRAAVEATDASMRSMADGIRANTMHVRSPPTPHADENSEVLVEPFQRGERFNFEGPMDKFRVAEHRDLVGFVLWTTAQKSRRAKWVIRITAANDLQAHHVKVKRGQRSGKPGRHSEVSEASHLWAFVVCIHILLSALAKRGKSEFLSSNSQIFSQYGC